MTEEVAYMWADILNGTVKGPSPGRTYWSVETYAGAKLVLLDTPKECFHAAVEAAVDDMCESRFRALENPNA